MHSNGDAYHYIAHVSHADCLFAQCSLEKLVNHIRNEPLEIEMNSMLAYLSFPAQLFDDANIFWAQIMDADTVIVSDVVLLASIMQSAFAQTSTQIEAKRLIINTNKTQNNMQCTSDEIKNNTDLVKAAVLAEILRWVNNDSIKRQPRRNAVNLLTSRYVFTWKRGPDSQRYMKCRLTAHGFKDHDAERLDSYSGTISRWGQRAVVATAVNNQWPICSMDVGEAFLKGLTFEEVQERRGGPRRQVSLMLPRPKNGEPSGTAILRTVKGI